MELHEVFERVAEKVPGLRDTGKGLLSYRAGQSSSGWSIDLTSGSFGWGIPEEWAPRLIIAACVRLLPNFWWYKNHMGRICVTDGEKIQHMVTDDSLAIALLMAVEATTLDADSAGRSGT